MSHILASFCINVLLCHVQVSASPYFELLNFFMHNGFHLIAYGLLAPAALFVYTLAKSAYIGNLLLAVLNEVTGNHHVVLVTMGVVLIMGLLGHCSVLFEVTCHSMPDDGYCCSAYLKIHLLCITAIVTAALGHVDA